MTYHYPATLVSSCNMVQNRVFFLVALNYIYEHKTCKQNVLSKAILYTYNGLTMFQYIVRVTNSVSLYLTIQSQCPSNFSLTHNKHFCCSIKKKEYSYITQYVYVLIMYLAVTFQHNVIEPRKTSWLTEHRSGVLEHSHYGNIDYFN